MDIEQTLENTGRGLRDRREKRGWTKTQAARLAGISRQDVARIESGASGVSWGKVFAYLNLLEVWLPKTIVGIPPTILDYWKSEHD
ncbi:MAG: helix-turn-helix transcriptional regulator [Actinomycetaceae bacterium]|nr:helix-turn-helix transcriptional regulator [Actinomycetaceae bacterium]MDY5854985.1 helix-turn-helix transcriptional regulator [Arcanobacterium sp.]